MEDGRIKRPRDEEGCGDEDTDMPKRRRGEGPRIELRILMQSKNAGAIIGKRGENINRLRNDYKANVTVPDSNGPERVLSLGAELGTVLDILLEILPEMEDSRNKQKDQRNRDQKEPESEVRIIVHQSQAGCIIGKEGYKVKMLREKTGAHIKVYSQCCPRSTDRVVAISGKPKIVVGCIEEISELLQQAPPKGVMNPYDPSNCNEYSAPEYGGFITGDMRAGKGLPRGAAPPPRPFRDYPVMRGGRMGMDGAGGGFRSNRGLKSFGGDMDSGMNRGAAFGRGSSLRGNMNGNNMGMNGRGMGGFGSFGGMPQDFSGDMNMCDQGMAFGEEHETTQVTIPKDLAGAIIGKGGSRITDIRRRSKAQIVIDEALPGSNDRIISISGSQDQIQNAQYLLQLSVKQNTSRN